MWLLSGDLQSWYIKSKGSTDCLVSNLLVPYSPTTFLYYFPARSLYQQLETLFEKHKFLFSSMQRHSKATWKWAKKGRVYLDLNQGCRYHQEKEL